MIKQEQMDVKRCQLLTFNFTFNIHQKQNVLYREKDHRYVSNFIVFI